MAGKEKIFEELQDLISDQLKVRWILSLVRCLCVTCMIRYVPNLDPRPPSDHTSLMVSCKSGTAIGSGKQRFAQAQIAHPFDAEYIHAGHFLQMAGQTLLSASQRCKAAPARVC